MWLKVTARRIHGTVSTTKVLVTSLLVDVLDVGLNTAVAIFTGSVVMLVEALAGLADLTSVGMMIFGYRNSKRRPNHQHPFGYGKEMYFWSVLAAFIIVSITATLSFYFGYKRFISPSPVENIFAAYLILGIAVITNAYAFFLGAIKLMDGRPLRRILHVFINSPSIAAKTTVALDGMGTLAALVGLCGLISLNITGNNHLDGLGAMLMSVVMAGFAISLLVGLRSLVIGQSASETVQQQIRAAAMQVPEVKEVMDIDTMMLGTENLLVNIHVNIRNGYTTDQVENIVKEIKQKVKTITPGMHVHVEPDAT